MKLYFVSPLSSAALSACLPNCCLSVWLGSGWGDWQPCSLLSEHKEACAGKGVPAAHYSPAQVSILPATLSLLCLLISSVSSSTCSESQREAALLLGQFATEPDCKVGKWQAAELAGWLQAELCCVLGLVQARIVQRGAVIPLISMLSNSEPNLQEMAAFALGRLAQVPACLLCDCVCLRCAC